MIAFLPSLGWQEMFLLLVIGLLLYGRNLPDAGRKLGRVVAQLRRSFQDFKDQLDREGDLREMKRTLDETRRELRDVTNVPRAVANPGQALRELTQDAIRSAPPVVDPADDVPPERAAQHDAHPHDQLHDHPHDEHAHLDDGSLDPSSPPPKREPSR